MALVTSILANFAKHDRLGSGTMDQSELIQILFALGMGESQAAGVVEQYKSARRNVVHYREFLRWLLGEDERAADSDSVAAELGAIAGDLGRVAASLASQLPDVSSELLSQVELLRDICGQLPGARSEAASREDIFRNEPLDGEADASDGSQFRRQAAVVIERSGPRGSVVDDMEEIPPGEARDKPALAYFGFCEGLKLYRSASVSTAMRLICSAPVPALGKTTYMEVFRALSRQRWGSHVYVKGGLVRDILRRSIGADVDISVTAPVRDLGAICRQRGWPCDVYESTNYILIGDRSSEEWLEGTVMYHEGSEPDFHADFAMNTLLYDFCNDVIIDRHGIGVPAVLHNRVSIPRVRDKWDNWLACKGLQALFRYYKFLLRGYAYEESEMTYVVDRLLGFWAQDAARTIKEGQRALGSMVGCADPVKIKTLEELVCMSFGKASSRPDSNGEGRAEGSGACFSSADFWWQHGWRPMLKIEGSQ